MKKQYLLAPLAFGLGNLHSYNKGVFGQLLLSFFSKDKLGQTLFYINIFKLNYSFILIVS